MILFNICRLNAFVTATLLVAGSTIYAQEENATGQMVKMCLFYPSPSGHARSDPIISQTCPADHVHTFYGPTNIHPNTSNQNLIDTSAQYSTTPYVENQSLYWHPSVYKVTTIGGTKTYSRVSQLDSSPYYRWDNSVLPRTEAFPTGFRMIAYSNQAGATTGGETGGNMFVECCNFDANDEEDCTNTVGGIEFPTQACDFLGFAFAMPTCWNGELGDTNDHVNHMAYTVDGTVAGACPDGYDRRLPQIQLFVRINNYEGGTYVLSDEADTFHVDFMNGWQDGKLKEIIDGCEVTGDVDSGYNPPCDCDDFLTPNEFEAEPVCDSDVRRYIVDEAIDVVTTLPRGTCQGPDLIAKSWDVVPPFTCDDTAPTPTAPTPTAPTPTAPTPTAPTPTTPTPTAPTPTAPTPTGPTGDDYYEECFDSSLRFKLNWNGKRITRGCDWVANKATLQRCKVEGVAEMCPETCETCDVCADSSARFTLTWNNKRIARDCSWVGNRATIQRCNVEGVAEACRETCEVC